MKDAVWRTIAVTLAGVVVTGAAAWLVFGQDKVTRTEMIEYIDTHAPWVRERGEVRSVIAGTRTDVQELKSAVDKLVATQQALIVEQRVLVTKLNAFIDKNGKR